MWSTAAPIDPSLIPAPMYFGIVKLYRQGVSRKVMVSTPRVAPLCGNSLCPNTCLPKRSIVVVFLFYIMITEFQPQEGYIYT